MYGAKTLTMYGAIHPKSDINKIYMKRKEGGRGLISVEQCVKGEENSLGFLWQTLKSW